MRFLRRNNKKGKLKMKLLIRFALIFIIQFALAHGGITVKKWEWWVVTIGYCVYGAVYRAIFM